jgi:hypothetical protein
MRRRTWLLAGGGAVCAAGLGYLSRGYWPIHGTDLGHIRDHEMGKHRDLIAQLSLHRSLRGIVAHITLRNASDTETTYILDYMVPEPDGSLSESIFGIEPNCEWTGALLKRRPPTWEDLEPLRPGETRDYETVLEQSYRLTPGKTIRVWYSAAHDTPDHPTEIMTVTSNVVEIVP